MREEEWPHSALGLLASLQSWGQQTLTWAPARLSVRLSKVSVNYRHTSVPILLYDDKIELL